MPFCKNAVDVFQAPLTEYARRKDFTSVQFFFWGCNYNYEAREDLWLVGWLVVLQHVNHNRFIFAEVNSAIIIFSYRALWHNVMSVRH